MAFFPNSFLLFLALFMAATLCSTEAYVINVGGSEGWTVNPKEDYDKWAAGMRFTQNDTLHFEYNKATDSVLEVDEDDYDKCQSSNPISKLENGVSSFDFERSGAFYFITGNKTNCEKGQKMHIIVMALRHHEPPAAAAASPPPVSTAAPLLNAPSPAPAAGTTITTFDVSTPTPSPTTSSAARALFSAASSLWVVMFSLALVGFIASA